MNGFSIKVSKDGKDLYYMVEQWIVAVRDISTGNLSPVHCNPT